MADIEEQDVTNGKLSAAEGNETSETQQNGSTDLDKDGEVDKDAKVENDVELDNGESKTKESQEEPVVPEQVNGSGRNSGIASPIDDCVGFNETLRLLVAGTSARKVKSKSKLLERVYQITADLHYVTWRPSKKPAFRSRIDIGGIHEIRMGRKGVLSQIPENACPEDCCMTIIHGPKYSQLVLVMGNCEERDSWSRALKILKKLSKCEHRKSAVREKWFRELFDSADVNGDGSLSLKEVGRLFQKLNIDAAHKDVKRRFQQADVDGSKNLSFDEFAALFKELGTRREIEVLFTKYARNVDFMTAKDLRMFLIGEQSQCPTVQECVTYIQTYEPTDEGKRSNQLSLDGFSLFLLGEDGDVVQKCHKSVCEDMDRPLSHYFINSSHNTYLMEDQLKGPSSVEAYIRALQKGCRCVELDCWDGENGDPIIFHGHTLTSKIQFKDVIIAIKEHAFQVSDYPVILSIENHCSIEQQHKMAEYMKDIFGDMLYTNPVDTSKDCLPSPNDLKGMILVKGKKLPPEKETEDDGEVSEEDEAEEIDDSGKKSTEKKSPEPSAPKKKKKLKLAASLSKCVNYVQSVHFDGFADAVKKTGKHWQMSSFAEAKASGYTQSKGVHFVEYNKRQLSRIYPAGWRVDSTNYNPIPMWATGCQIVALNFQTNCKEMDLNRGRFVPNGGSGYVLKPDVLCDEHGIFDVKSRHEIPGVVPKLYTITVISGQNLPKPGSEHGEIIDPFVRLEVHGIEADCKTFKTKVVNNNGFNPQWNEKFQFHSLFPELAILRFVVMDNDTLSDDFIGQFSLPLSSLALGYRHVHLLSDKGEPLDQATIFVHIACENPANAFYKMNCHFDNALDKVRFGRKYFKTHHLGIEAIDGPVSEAVPILKRAEDLVDDCQFATYRMKIVCGLEAGAGLEECIDLLKSLNVTLKADGEVYTAELSGEHSNVKVYAELVNAFNDLCQTFKATLSDADQVIGKLTSAHDACKAQNAAVQELILTIDNKKSFQTALGYTRNMQTMAMFIKELTKQKQFVQDTLAVIKHVFEVVESPL